MSATQTTPPRNGIERLLQDLVDSENVAFSVVSGDRFFSAHLRGSRKEALRCTCHADVWSIEAGPWTVHTWPANTQRVRFVREPDPHRPAHESLSVQFVGPNGQSQLRAHFTPLYDEREQPLPAPFARWEELRANYGGRDEVAVDQGALRLPAAV
jgi:hypothetical protein